MRFRQSVHGELEEVPEEAEDEEAPAEQEQERIVYPARPTPWEERMLRLGTDMAHPHAGTEHDNDSEPPEHAGTSGPSKEHPPAGGSLRRRGWILWERPDDSHQHGLAIKTAAKTKHL